MPSCVAIDLPSLLSPKASLRRSPSSAGTASPAPGALERCGRGSAKRPFIFLIRHYRIDDKTVKRLWEHSASPVQGELPFSAYHHHADRYQARLQVVKLYYQGWSKHSISQFMQVSRPTVNRWIQRFEAEHFAGLEDKSRVPHTTPRKVWFPLMIEIYHLQKRH